MILQSFEFCENPTYFVIASATHDDHHIFMQSINFDSKK